MQYNAFSELKRILSCCFIYFFHLIFFHSGKKKQTGRIADSFIFSGESCIELRELEARPFLCVNLF
jgi:hypothetical protein